MIKRSMVKSCCGKVQYVFDLPHPINRSHVEEFRKNGYKSPPHFETAGVLYLQAPCITATGSFGTKKVQVSIGCANSNSILNSFSTLLERVITPAP